MTDPRTTEERIAALRQGIVNAIGLIEHVDGGDGDVLRHAARVIREDAKYPSLADAVAEIASRLTASPSAPSREGDISDTALVDWLEAFFVSAGYDAGFAFINRPREPDDPAVGVTGDAVLVYRKSGPWADPRFESLREAIGFALRASHQPRPSEGTDHE